MQKTLCLLLVAVLLFKIPTLLAHPVFPPNDTVRIKGIPKPLTWVNKHKGSAVANNNTVALTAGKGTDLYNFAGGNFNVATMPILLFEPDSNFVLTAKLKVDFKKQFDGGSLMIYTDSTQWVKFLFENSHSGKLVICSGVTNGFTDDNTHNEVAGPDIYLRIGKSGTLFSLYYSANGKDWKMVRLFPFLPAGKFKIGFSSQSPEGEKCTTQFTNIVYSPKAFGDLWTGE
jgi:regulation of enolase protein 1 (concanavalin A-like superfamily)